MREKDKRDITIKDIAIKAGVSQATVGRVVGNYGSVSEKTREKVMAVVNELNYVPNSIAQSMKSKNTKTIGVVIGNIANPFFGEIVHEIEVKCARAGFNMIINTTGECIDREVAALKMLHAKRVDGLIIATTQPSDKVFSKDEEWLYYGQIPTVYIDREIFSVEELCVKTDHFGGAYHAGNYFYENGHVNVGIIGGVKTSTMYQRIEGFKKAMQEHGVSITDDWVKFGEVASTAEGKAFAYELLNEHPEMTAIFPLNNLLCIGVLQALKEMDLKIPQQISLIGWDDFPMAEIMNPGLTMVTQDTRKIGEIATEKLLNLIEAKEQGTTLSGEKRITLKTEFITRASCAKLRT